MPPWCKRHPFSYFTSEWEVQVEICDKVWMPGTYDLQQNKLKKEYKGNQSDGSLFLIFTLWNVQLTLKH